MLKVARWYRLASSTVIPLTVALSSFAGSLLVRKSAKCPHFDQSGWVKNIHSPAYVALPFIRNRSTSGAFFRLLSSLIINPKPRQAIVILSAFNADIPRATDNFSSVFAP